MSQELQRVRTETALGGLTWHGRAEAPEERRPVLVVVPGVLMSIRAVNKLPDLMGDLCHVALAELPLQGDAKVAEGTVDQVAEAVAAGVLAAFGSRPIVIAGFDDGALAAVGAAGVVPNLGAVAIEPPLDSWGLWPPRARLAEVAKTAPELRVRRFISEVYGVGDEPTVARRHHRLFGGLRRPVDVIVGARALVDQLSSLPDPSWVSTDDRAWLGAAGNVVVHVAVGAGHDVGRDAGAWTLARLREAVTRAADPPRDDETVARQLALAAPLTALRVGYRGPQPAAFAEAYLARNPAAVFADDACDLFILHDAELGDGAARLAAGGEVVATASYPQAAAMSRGLAASGLTRVHADPYLAPRASSLHRARNGPAQPVTPVAIFPFAQTLMEIRTRLPAQALRTEAGLDVSYAKPPAHISRLIPGPPRVLIAQRPGYWTPELWRHLTAAAIVDQTVQVIEYDDHPDLVSEMLRGRPQDDWEWERFRLAHAIQTSTEALGELFRRYNPEVRVFPNAAFDIAPFPEGPRKPRVFYGGVTRGPFAVAVAAGLGPAVEACPEAEFLVAGDRAVFDALPTDRKRYVEYMSYVSYLSAMAECSVSLSPLESRPMVETKSDAKFLDAARAGVLTIASPVVYEGVIRSGENGLIARTLEDWGPQLSLALTDHAGRERMARAAWEEVRATRMFAAQIPERRAWYADLVARREALSEGIMQRSPDVAATVALARR